MDENIGIYKAAIVNLCLCGGLFFINDAFWVVLQYL